MIQMQLAMGVQKPGKTYGVLLLDLLGALG